MNWNAVSLLISSLLILQTFAKNEDYPRLETPYGAIRGYYKTFKNREYKVFTGIPYAESPEGNRRFQPPEPIKPWDDELDATKPANKCAQFNIGMNKIEGIEDCLYLNVFVPRVTNATLLPVIFIIHGGAFQYGSSEEHQADNFMRKDVILVLPNYRLGPLGFLSTEDNLISGNMGLKDQSLALRWASENVKYFGGDSKRITLVGCSAGGASVHYHYLSPLSRGLFQNAISLSGTAIVPWAFAKHPMNDTTKLAEMVNCPTTSKEALVNCLKDLPADEICRGSQKLLMSEFLTIRIDRPAFVPVAENVEKGYFINRSPEQILESHDAYDVPWIAGVVSEEGMILTFGFILNETSLAYVDENWESVGPYIMFLRDQVPKEKQAEVARLARQHYFGNDTFRLDDSTFKNLIHLVGDRGFGNGMQRAAVLQAKANKSPVYAYYYNYQADVSLSHKLFNSTKKYGVCHCDDIYLMFVNGQGTHGNLEDKVMQNDLIEMWYSYSEKGYPDIGTYWPEVESSSANFQYLNIHNPRKIFVEKSDNFAEKRFWDTVQY